MRMKSINHLSTEAITELETCGIYETKKYRYIIDNQDGKCYRIHKELLGTTEALNPENWTEQ